MSTTEKRRGNAQTRQLQEIQLTSLHDGNTPDSKTEVSPPVHADAANIRKSYQEDPDTSKNDEEDLTYYQLLKKNRPFRLYLFSYIANHMGEWLTYLASISAIEEIQLANGMDKTSRTAISCLIIFRLTPNILLSPFGGVLADGSDRRNSMIRLDIAGALVAVVFLLAIEQKSIPLIYVATFLQECVAGLYEPSRAAIIPLLVPEENHLKLATTMAGLAYATVAAFGSAAGGFLVSMFGVRSCIGTYHTHKRAYVRAVV
jgi:MFS family permease